MDIKLELNSFENKFRQVCLKICELNQDIKLFLVGGWTRDKLMKIESDDIDIVISNFNSDIQEIINNFVKIFKENNIIIEKPEKRYFIQEESFDNEVKN